ncbi:MAG: hypothetical protein KDC34_00485 [Saprospiraceae bacterium]|nr:hypothetical protein [Saprospiraceae bacterium]
MSPTPPFGRTLTGARFFGLLACFFLIFLPYGGFSQRAAAAAGLPGKSVVVTVNDPTGAVDGYNLYLPKSYAKSKHKYPILMFLQGGLGVGGEIEDINQWGLPLLLTTETDMTLERNQYLLDSFIVISPHMTDGPNQDRQFYNQESVIRSIIKTTKSQYRVDNKRIYITGLSRGGHGTWGLAARMNDVFAAAVPICGSTRGVEDFNTLLKMPLWVAHNIGDGLVDFSNSQEAVAKLEELGSEKFLKIKTTDPEDPEYLDHQKIFSYMNIDSHDAWTDMYSNAAVYKWLLEQSKK